MGFRDIDLWWKINETLTRINKRLFDSEYDLIKLKLKLLIKIIILNYL